MRKGLVYRRLPWHCLNCWGVEHVLVHTTVYTAFVLFNGLLDVEIGSGSFPRFVMRETIHFGGQDGEGRRRIRRRYFSIILRWQLAQRHPFIVPKRRLFLKEKPYTCNNSMFFFFFLDAIQGHVVVLGLHCPNLHSLHTSAVGLYENFMSTLEGTSSIGTFLNCPLYLIRWLFYVNSGFVNGLVR